MINKRTGKKEKRPEKCPKCGGNTFRTEYISLRKNYPYGKKSKPITTIKERVRICSGTRCGYREHLKFPPTFMG